MGFFHVTNSPEYPQSNGLFERTIQTVKKTLHKCFQTGDNPFLALLTLHTTPGKNNSPSPAAKLINCQLRTLLPSIRNDGYDLCRSSSTNMQKVKQHISNKHVLPSLKIGDNIRVYDGKTWSRIGKVNIAFNQGYTWY